MIASTAWPPESWPKDLHQYVQYLKDHLEKIDRWESLVEAVRQARYGEDPEVDEGIDEFEQWGINTVEDFLGYASYLLTDWIPNETEDGRFIYYVITVFYYVFDLPPMSDLQTPVQRASIQGDMPLLTPVSNWIVGYAKRMGTWLDTEESLTPESYETFVNSPPYRMKDPCDYRIPDRSDPRGGFKNFNEFFSRFLREPQHEVRPCAKSSEDPTRDNIICFPADSTFDSWFEVSEKSKVLIKGVHWPISSLLAGSKYKDQFAGGVWAHAFLNTFNYHRQHIPVDGTVLEAYNVEGCAYLQVEAKDDGKGGKKKLQLRRPWGDKPEIGDHELFMSKPNAPNQAGYQFIQLRGNIVIKAKNPDIGLIAVIPMGMAHVSSVKIHVKPGQEVGKGDMMSHFEFGGSDIVLVFQKKAGVGNWVPNPPPADRTSFMGEIFCTASGKAN